MEIVHLEKRVIDYKESIKIAVDKKVLWKNKIKPLLVTILKAICSTYEIGWKVQELSWIHNNEAVNITFDSFPKDLIDCTNEFPEFQFITGGSLIFSQSYSGDVNIFIILPFIDTVPNETIEFGAYDPAEVTEKLIIEMVNDFLKEMIKWEVPTYKVKVGFKTTEKQ